MKPQGGSNRDFKLNTKKLCNGDLGRVRWMEVRGVYRSRSDQDPTTILLILLLLNIPIQKEAGR
jgi:hypothetical protein